MDYFVSQLQIVLPPVLGVNAIRVKAQPSRDSPIFHLRLAKAGVDAQAQEIDGEFTMLAGSEGGRLLEQRRQYRQHPQAYASTASQHEQLDPGQQRIAVRGDTVYSPATCSPARRHAIALGRSCNGRRDGPLLTGRCSAVGKSRGGLENFRAAQGSPPGTAVVFFELKGRRAKDTSRDELRARPEPGRSRPIASHRHVDTGLSCRRVDDGAAVDILDERWPVAVIECERGCSRGVRSGSSR